jgi:hypothetical protein
VIKKDVYAVVAYFKALAQYLPGGNKTSGGSECANYAEYVFKKDLVPWN